MQLEAEEEKGGGGGVGPLGRLACLPFLPSNAWTASDKLIIGLGIMPKLRFPLKVVAGQR